MSDILVRGLRADVIRKLKDRARRHGRSLQGEARRLLEQAAGPDRADIAATLDRWHRRFAGRCLSSSMEMIRQDRKR